MKNTKDTMLVSTEIGCNFSFDFKLEIGKRTSNRHKTKIYNVLIKINKDYILFGRCYIRRDTTIEVIPNLSYFHIKNTDLEEETAKKIALEITKMILINL